MQLQRGPGRGGAHLAHPAALGRAGQRQGEARGEPGHLRLIEVRGGAHEAWARCSRSTRARSAAKAASPATSHTQASSAPFIFGSFEV